MCPPEGVFGLQPTQISIIRYMYTGFKLLKAALPTSVTINVGKGFVFFTTPVCFCFLAFVFSFNPSIVLRMYSVLNHKPVAVHV